MAKSSKQTKSSEFRVVLTGLNLSSDMEKNIESEIKKVVMKHIASIDLKGDLLVSPLGKIGGPGGGGPTQGINIRAKV
jgi:hypothetical protein